MTTAPDDDRRTQPSATAPTPDPARGPRPGAHTVRLRWRGGTWISPTMTTRQATQLADDLRARVDAVGDGPGLLDFTCRDGRTAAVRARDIIAVEHGPWIERPRPDIPVEQSAPDGGDATGTDWLRQLAGISAADVADRVVRP